MIVHFSGVPAGLPRARGVINVDYVVDDATLRLMGLQCSQNGERLRARLAITHPVRGRIEFTLAAAADLETVNVAGNAGRDLFVLEDGEVGPAPGVVFELLGP